MAVNRKGLCPHCGAPKRKGLDVCPYCSVPYDEQVKAARPVLRAGKPRLDPNAGEFGARGRWPLALAVIGGAAIYALGWTQEDTQYWLAAPAVLLWAGALPLWLASFAFAWRPTWGGWLAALAFGIPVALVHMGVIGLIDGRLNDDAVGISLAFGGAALGGWLLGRGAHEIVRRARVKTVEKR